MKKDIQTQLTILGACAVAGIGLYLYCNRDTILATKEDVQREGTLLTNIVLRLQSASYRAKANLTPMTRTDINNIVFLETELHNQEHKSRSKVCVHYSDNSKNAAVKHITLKSACASVQAKIYCR